MVTEELQKKINKSIERLRAFCPPEGYYLAFSGGKDSIVCKQLLIESGCKFDAHYRVTSVDPPELVRYIKQYHPDVAREVPRDADGKPITMWNLIPKKLMPPTRLVRYCCQELKENGGDGRMVVTGVRWAESIRRKNNQGMVTIMSTDKKMATELAGNSNFQSTKSGGYILVNDNDDGRRMVEQCYTRRKTTINPIIDWTDHDVWNYIRDRKIPYCELYDKGYTRLGCLGCPMSTKQVAELNAYPKYKQAYLRAFAQMIEQRKKRGRNDAGRNWETPEGVYHWWVQDGVLPEQMTMNLDDIA